MKNHRSFNCVLFGLILTIFTVPAVAEITVDKSQGELNITSDFNGTVTVKIIGPDDVVVVDDKYYGNSFYWLPSSGPDGAYRYDVRIVEESFSEDHNERTDTKSEYAGGSIEVVNGLIPVNEEENQAEEEQ